MTEEYYYKHDPERGESFKVFKTPPPKGARIQGSEPKSGRLRCGKSRKGSKPGQRGSGKSR